MASTRAVPAVAQRAPAEPRGRHLRPWRALLAGAAWVGTIFSIFLHLIDDSGQQITGLPGVLDILGTVSGLIAMNSLLFMLLLTARVPVIDRALGQVRAVRWRRLLAQVAALGALTHTALILTGAGWNNRDDFAGPIGLLWTGNLQLTFASATLLVLAALASVLAMHRGLRHEAQSLFIFLSYAAMLLAIPHMFRFNPVFLPGTAQHIYWGILLVSVGACLLWYRFLSPLRRSHRHRVRLARTVHLAPDLLHVEFTGRNLDKLGTRGGQCFTWRLLTPQLWSQSRLFFLSAAPARNRLRITVRVTDEYTAELAVARPGTRVIFAGPYGAFTDASRTRSGLVLIGSGTNLAPIRSLLETTTAHPADTIVILRASEADDLVLLDELQELCDDRGIALHLMTGPRHEDRWVSIGYADHDLSTLAPNLGDSDVFVCGPDEFVDSVLAEARSLGVAPEQCHEERPVP